MVDQKFISIQGNIDSIWRKHYFKEYEFTTAEFTFRCKNKK